MKIRILVLLPIRYGTISHFCKWYPEGLVRGLNATLAKLARFGETVPEVEVDVVDISTRKKHHNPVDPLVDSAKSACDRFRVEEYDVLITGTSPVSRAVVKHIENSGFQGAHFLVAFDKDIVRENKSCLRLLPHYDLELPLYVQVLNRFKPSSGMFNCVFLHLSDETSTNLARDFLSLSEQTGFVQRNGFNVRSHMVEWDKSRWSEADTKRAIEGADLLIVSIYSEQLDRLAAICNNMSSTLRPKNVLINLDGVDRHDKNISKWNGLWAPAPFGQSTDDAHLGNNWMLAPLCELDGLEIPEAESISKVIVREHDNLLNPLLETLPKFRSKRKRKGNYVAGYAFDTGTAIILSATKPDRASGEFLSKEDVLEVLPFQGITGPIRVNDAGDLQTALCVTRVRRPSLTNRLLLEPLGTLPSVPTVSLYNLAAEQQSKDQYFFLDRIQDFVGGSIRFTKYLCFLDITHQDWLSSDKDVHWCVAAPSYRTLVSYRAIIKTFEKLGAEREKGYRIGNHPVVRALLPILSTKQAFEATAIEILNGTPAFRLPEDDKELEMLFKFIDSTDIDANWKIEFAEYLSSSWEDSVVTGDLAREHFLPSLVFSKDLTRYRELTNADTSVHAPRLTDLWSAFADKCKCEARSNISLRANGGGVLQQVLMAPVFFRPNSPERISGFPTELSELQDHSVAQIYIGIGWVKSDEKDTALKEAYYVLESLRAWRRCERRPYTIMWKPHRTTRTTKSSRSVWEQSSGVA